jgi:2-polyprenyl-3-methyl-5-hydroxy-6-metoxy-1,4-benzoquinol methylase
VKRGYQENFYNLSERVRDPNSRQKQANKIAIALTRHARVALGESRCLDLGCSSGMITRAVAPLVRTMVGLDYDEIALAAIPPDPTAPAAFLQGDAMQLPFADESFDVVICAQVYEHVPVASRLFGEMARVLRPGGTVFFSGPNWLFPVEPHYLLPFLHWLPAGLADAWLRLLRRGDHYYERSASVWRLRRMLRAFEIEDITPEVIEQFCSRHDQDLAARIVRALPVAVWQLALPLVPNFNWILYKRP